MKLPLHREHGCLIGIQALMTNLILLDQKNGAILKMESLKVTSPFHLPLSPLLVVMGKKPFFEVQGTYQLNGNREGKRLKGRTGMEGGWSGVNCS